MTATYGWVPVHEPSVRPNICLDNGEYANRPAVRRGDYSLARFVAEGRALGSPVSWMIPDPSITASALNPDLRS
jgi:hypothetical protein